MISLRIYILSFFLLINSNFSWSQENNCSCIDHLKETSEVIRNSISYKSQVKKLKRGQEFDDWKNTIEKEIVNDSLSSYFCAGYLQKFISFIKDKHNQIYATKKELSSIIPFYPKTFETSTDTKDSISGIYYQGKEKIIVKKESDNLWYGILLESNSTDWKKGMIRLRIHKTKNHSFEIFEFYNNGFLYYQNGVKIRNGRIHSTFWNKANKYFFNKNHKANFNFENLNANTSYISIKTLKRTNPLIREAKQFYKKIVNKLNRKILIIDLRNNGGGSTKQFKPLLKLIKKNKEIEKVYVLVNFKTGSAAELSAYLLSIDSRTTIAGENTRGMLTYGWGNKSFSGRLNCGDIEYDFSTKTSNKKLLKFENVGLSPELVLTNQLDWIDQILKMQEQIEIKK